MLVYRIPGNFRGAIFSRISRFLLSREIKFREIPPTGRGHVALIGHSRKFISQKFVSRKFSAAKISQYTVFLYMCILAYRILLHILAYVSIFQYILVYSCILGRPTVSIAWNIEGSSNDGHFVSAGISTDINITAPINITLSCEVSSSSNSSQSFSVFWYFRGQPVTTNSSFPRLLNDSALFLSSGHSLEYFLSSYQCVVKGEYHWRSSHLRIIYTGK